MIPSLPSSRSLFTPLYSVHSKYKFKYHNASNVYRYTSDHKYFPSFSRLHHAAANHPSMKINANIYVPRRYYSFCHACFSVSSPSKSASSTSSSLHNGSGSSSSASASPTVVSSVSGAGLSSFPSLTFPSTVSSAVSSRVFYLLDCMQEGKNKEIIDFFFSEPHHSLYNSNTTSLHKLYRYIITASYYLLLFAVTLLYDCI